MRLGGVKAEPEFNVLISIWGLCWCNSVFFLNLLVYLCYWYTPLTFYNESLKRNSKSAPFPPSAFASESVAGPNRSRPNRSDLEEPKVGATGSCRLAAKAMQGGTVEPVECRERRVGCGFLHVFWPMTFDMVISDWSMVVFLQFELHISDQNIGKIMENITKSDVFTGEFRMMCRIFEVKTKPVAWLENTSGVVGFVPWPRVKRNAESQALGLGKRCDPAKHEEIV